jgi:hypothetical protein
VRLRRSPGESPASSTLLEDLSAFDLARATRVPVETALAWADGELPAGATGDRLRALGNVVDALQSVGLARPHDRAEWLRRPNRAFERQAPIDVVALGESRRILDYVETLS